MNIFEADASENVTETWNAYERGALKVLVGGSNDPDAEPGDALTVTVACGWVE